VIRPLALLAGLLAGRLLLAGLADLLPAEPPPPVAVTVAYTGDGAVVISYKPVPGQWLACALRGAQLLACDLDASGAMQLGPGSVDADLRVAPGDVVQVRVWNEEGAVIGEGVAQAGCLVALPLVG
jgi:hypothetical protein